MGNGRQVINYAEEDFTQKGQLYDLILDVVGTRSIFDYNPATIVSWTHDL